MRVLGIDPGLRHTAAALVDGTRLQGAITRHDAARDGRAMAAWVLGLVEAGLRDHHPGGIGLELVAVERFAHQGWRGRRIDTGPQMGALVERIILLLEGRVDLMLVNPEVSKAGYPGTEAERARLLPSELRNKHERDAFLAATTAQTLYRRLRATPTEQGATWEAQLIRART